MRRHLGHTYLSESLQDPSEAFQQPSEAFQHQGRTLAKIRVGGSDKMRGGCRSVMDNHEMS